MFGPPESERDPNLRRKLLDDLTLQESIIDISILRKRITAIIDVVKSKSVDEGKKSVSIGGGAGSGKTILGREIAKKLGTDSFNLDDYIVGGYTPNTDKYMSNFKTALYKVWSDLPNTWVIEHVLGCSQTLINILQPSFVILLVPNEGQLKDVARIRATVLGSDYGKLRKRAIQTSNEAKQQFAVIKWPLLRIDANCLLKSYLL